MVLPKQSVSGPISTNVRCDINSDAYANPLASVTELMDNVQQIWNAAMENDGD